MGKKLDTKVVNIGPIKISKEFWIEYGYCLLPIERAAKDILAAKDVDSFNMLVAGLASMLGGLHLDLTGATRPDVETEQ